MNGRGLKNGHHLGGAKAASVKVEERKEGVGQLALLANPPVGNAEGNPAGVVGRDRENRLDKGRISPDVRGHDEDVFGKKSGVCFKKGKEPVLQDLDFPHGTVAGVDLDGIIRFVDALFPIPPHAPVPEVEDITLDAWRGGSSPRVRQRGHAALLPRLEISSKKSRPSMPMEASRVFPFSR